ncbi:hypothetical protein AMR72_11640 [Flavobacterium psychrophilum]|nr:hypothetical protein AMR72_11640 [Flavobacterium psychrophilum]AOE53110.1 hypothetical protein ALW18_11630 [Flavobacterium psychrophilum]
MVEIISYMAAVLTMGKYVFKFLNMLLIFTLQILRLSILSIAGKEILATREINKMIRTLILLKD